APGHHPAQSGRACGNTTVLKDENGAAAIVALRNTSAREQVQVPVAIDVKGAHGTSLFRNDAPGLEPTLIAAPLIGPHRTFLWVNDQINAAQPPTAVVAKVGPARAKAPARLPRIVVEPGGLADDPASGVYATGRVKNDSRIVQRKLVLFAVARKAGKVVAAGRGQIKKLNPGRHAKDTIFFIGNPRGAKIAITAPPSTLE